MLSSLLWSYSFGLRNLFSRCIARHVKPENRSHAADCRATPRGCPIRALAPRGQPHDDAQAKCALTARQREDAHAGFALRPRPAGVHGRGGDGCADQADGDVVYVAGDGDRVR